MNRHRVPKSPTYPPGHQWAPEKRKGYESDITALVRAMLNDEAVAEDQRAAWERWRKEPSGK